VKKLKKISKKPICVGFGISTPEQARKIASFSDGVIVGSAIINKIEQYKSSRKKMISSIGGFVESLSRAVKG